LSEGTVEVFSIITFSTFNPIPFSPPLPVVSVKAGNKQCCLGEELSEFDIARSLGFYVVCFLQTLD